MPGQGWEGITHNSNSQGEALKTTWMRGFSAGFATGQMAFPEHLLTNGCQAWGWAWWWGAGQS